MKHLSVNMRVGCNMQYVMLGSCSWNSDGHECYTQVFRIYISYRDVLHSYWKSNQILVQLPVRQQRIKRGSNSIKP